MPVAAAMAIRIAAEAADHPIAAVQGRLWKHIPGHAGAPLLGSVKCMFFGGECKEVEDRRCHIGVRSFKG